MSDPEIRANQAAIPAIFSIYVRVVHWLAIGGGILATICLTLLTFLVFSEVAVSSLSKIIPGMRTDIPIAWEYSGYLMGTAFMLGSAITMRAGGHIRVTALLFLISPKIRHVVETFATLVGTLFSAFLSWALIAFTYRSFMDGNVSFASYTPLWIPQTGMTIGASILTLALVERLFRCLLGVPLELPSLKAASSEDIVIEENKD
ncbi:TRAP transporter small permease [Cohaesibacter intestini]|uniref:TRAP transporter small permease n=1 Tax=Cohaesibacter intestini TaxID=2211145 RepID=UPI000DEA54CB|nr:TRAP transporter small permease [Cohaesibacter intestini]